jgi:putative DNA-invertase from lambdoid prophage Rac
MAATAQAQAEVTKEAQRAEIEHAKAQGGRYRGRKPPYGREQLQTVQNLPGQNVGTSEIARATGQTIPRINADPVEAEANLAAWGL